MVDAIASDTRRGVFSPVLANQLGNGSLHGLHWNALVEHANSAGRQKGFVSEEIARRFARQHKGTLLPTSAPVHPVP